MKIAVDLDDTLSVVDRLTRAQAYIARKNLPFTLVNPHAQRLVDVFDWERADVEEFLAEGGISVFTEAEARTNAAEVLARWREEGHTVIVLTARMKDMFINPEKVSRDWLEKRRIPYDLLVAECADKGAYCAENGVSILVDNDLNHCLSAQNRGVNAVLMVSKETLPCAREVRYGGATWKQVYEVCDELLRISAIERASALLCGGEQYDGWFLRERGEGLLQCSVRPVYPSALPFAYKATVCEERYAVSESPCRFLLTTADGELDGYLRGRGYYTERTGLIYALEKIPVFLRLGEVKAYFTRSQAWQEDFLAVTGEACTLPKTEGEEIYISVFERGLPVCVGYGARVGEWVELSFVHTKSEFRRKGYGRTACERVLAEGKRLGGKKGYARIENTLSGGMELVKSIGFARSHDYWYRRK